MSHKYKVKNPEGIYFITLTIVDWVDLLTCPVYKHILIDSLEYSIKNKGLTVFAYVIMTNHLHLLVKSEEDTKLEDTIRDLKKYTSKELIAAINEHPESRREWLLRKFAYAAERTIRGKKYKVWKDGFHSVEMFNRDILEQKLNYIHENPVHAEIVINPEDYKYSSAISYSGGIGQLEVETIR